MQKYFLRTERIGFSEWKQSDLSLAEMLWGNPDVTKYICASGKFRPEEVAARLQRELKNNVEYQMQYWKISELESDALIGCCGLSPHGENCCELGYHLLPRFWGKGYATEAAGAVVAYAFANFPCTEIFAMHHPKNAASKNVLMKLGFHYIGTRFYEPTGLEHPSYCLKKASIINK